MCGFAGYINLDAEQRASREVVTRMADKLIHRGPDSDGYFVEDNVALGFRRLSIIDLDGGDQPIYSEDGSVVLLCNGEIYNYRELRKELVEKGHTFRTRSDVEVLAHLYEEEGVEFLNRLNGQFAFVIYDKTRKLLFLARDQMGINPLYYALIDGVLIFASEIKAILEHPLAPRAVDLTGLDQVFSFPGLVSPRTMFKGINSLKSGHLMTVENRRPEIKEYWDLDYPLAGELSYDQPESFYVDQLHELFRQSVEYRLQADVPVGFYLSGGLDSSMIGAMINRVSPHGRRHSFSIGFTTREISESRYQRMLADRVESEHHEIIFDWPEISGRFFDMIYHSECPVKETYNTCSMALSEAARNSGVPVILTGEGADELFAGYVGYRFDQFGIRDSQKYDLDAMLEEELREKLWGDRNFFYETDHHAFRETKTAIYSDTVNESYAAFDCLDAPLVNVERLRGRHPVHQRSYLDFKLRLSDHLITDHGDKMALANSVEARYPFLDKAFVDFSKQIPPHLKLNGFKEKYILKRIAEGMIPPEIINREKFGFHAPGSPYLLQQNIEWVNDMLSAERIRRQGYFNPDVIERLKSKYAQKGFKLNLPFENDLLIVVLSFNVFLELFKMPSLN